MMDDAVLPYRPRTVRKRTLTGGGFWPAVPALAYLFVFMVLPMATLLLFGFVTIDRGRHRRRQLHARRISRGRCTTRWCGG